MNNALLQKELGEIAERHRLAENRVRIAAIQPGSIQTKIAFLGEFNTGKSTLLNALLKRKLLPMLATPANANITEITFGEEEFARVQRINEDGLAEISPIPWSELANEILGNSPGKKILLTLKDSDFPSGDTLFVDTPGVASIESTHDDITYGYLPDVDVAFVLLNPHQGTVPKTLVQFLTHFPPALLEKIYFVIGRKDEIPPNQLGGIRETIREQLTPLFPNPRILMISASHALEAIEDPAQREASGITELEHILRHEIPGRKQEIEQHRIKSLLQDEREKLSVLLREKAKAVNWDTARLDTEIAALKNKIEALQKDMSDFRRKFQTLKDRALQAIGPIIKEHVEIIGTRAVRNEPYGELIAGMVDEIRSQVEVSMKELTIIEFRTIGKNIETLLQALIDQESARIRDIANIITDAGTFALTAWLVPGPTPGLDPDEAIVAASVVFAEEAAGNRDKTKSGHAKSGGFGEGVLNFIGGLGSMIKGINPLEKLKNTILPYVVNPRLARVLTKRMTIKLQELYDSLGQTLAQEIEKRYMAPLREMEDLLIKTRQDRSDKIDQSDTEKQTLDSDLSRLAALK